MTYFRTQHCDHRLRSTSLILLATCHVPIVCAWSIHRVGRELPIPPVTSSNTINDDLVVGRENADRRPQHRRLFLQHNSVAALSLLSAALLAPDPATASLLDEYGTDPSKIQQQTPTKRTAVVTKAKDAGQMEPNLRSNYYYPTNKKRYLPRIKKCNDLLPNAAVAIGTGHWDDALEFALRVADDTILPMKLYTSSLQGGGTNVKVAFAKDMMAATTAFERAQRKLVRAVTQHDRDTSSQSLTELASALLAYRTAGRLLGPDAGADIPSIDDIRRSAVRGRASFDLK